MSVLKKILLALVIAVGAFLIYVGFQPAELKIERTMTMNAPVAEVFAEVNNFQNWQEWSPWAKLDPNATATFEGPTSGVGAVFKWAGNSDVGSGQMTMLESTPNQSLRIQTDFTEPMVATNDVRFTFASEGSGTKVTWMMTGENNFVGRIFCILFNMQAMLEADFDRGLTSLKGIVEAN